MSTLTVSSGVTSSGLNVGAGEVVQVLAHGSVSATVVGSGGKVNLASGAAAWGMTISSGGTVAGPGDIYDVVFDAGVLSGGTIQNLGTLEVLSGGHAVDITFNNADLTVSQGGIISGAQLSYTQADIYGSASGDVMAAGDASQWVETGGVARGTIIGSGGRETVIGQSISAVVDNDGLEQVWGGGAVSGTVVNSGGELTLETGAVAVGARVSSGGLVNFFDGLVVGSGQTFSAAQGGYFTGPEVASGVTVLSGGIMQFGGNPIVLSGGAIALGANETLSQVTVSAGGIVSGAGFVTGYGNTVAGLLSGVTASGSFASVDIASGGTASNVNVAGGMAMSVEGVFRGGSVSNASVTVNSGGTFTGAVVKSGGVEALSSGAIASGDTVSSGGTVRLDVTVVSAGQNLGGVRTATTIVSGNTILSGGIEDVSGATTVLSGGVLNTLADDTLVGVTISSGGVLDGAGLVSGTNHVAGHVSGVTVWGDFNGSSLLELSSGGIANGAGVGTLSTLEIDSGAVAIGTIVQTGPVDFEPLFDLGGTQVVESGGIASASQINSGGTEIVSSGGHTSGFTVSSGGTEELLQGAVVSGGVVNSGGTLIAPGIIRSGQTSAFSGVVLSTSFVNGAVVSTGVVTSTTVIDGVTVSSGGIVEELGIVVLSGGTLKLSAGQSATNVTVSSGGKIAGPGSLLGDNYAAGSVSGVTLSGGDLLELLSGGRASKVNVGYISGVGVNGQLQVDGGAVAVSTTLMGGGAVQGIKSGGVASSTLIEGWNGNGGAETVSAGGLTVRTSVGLGTQTILGGGAASATVVFSGGSENIYGVARGGAIDLDGFATVFSGGVISAASIDNGGTLTVSAAGAARSVLVSSGGVATIYGAATATKVQFGGTQVIEAGGVASATAVTSGGFEVVGSGGVINGAKVAAGGNEVILSGATAHNVTISSGAAVYFEQVVSAGQTYQTMVETTQSTISGATVQAGADLDVVAGVESGGTLDLEAGTASYGLAVVSGGVVSGPGTVLGQINGVAGRIAGVTLGNTADFAALVIEAGGLAIGVDVHNGEMEVQYKAVASGGLLESGSYEIVDAGGTAVGLSVQSGGLLVDNGQVSIAGDSIFDGVLSGSGSIIEAAGGDLVLAGSVNGFTGRAVISGGTMELASAGAFGSSSIVFSEPSTGSAVLQIDAPGTPIAGGTFANVISNFSGPNDYIDLRGIAYVSGATATVSGHILTLSEGGKTYQFKLAGSIGASFPVLSDGHGGTLIDPKAAVFVQAAAAFAPLDASTMALASSSTSTTLSNLVAPITSAVILHR